MPSPTRKERLRRAARAYRGSEARQPPTPTPPPAGAVVAPPDYVGVGAMKSGTSWWAQLIAAHPGVRSGGGKELHYFDRFCEVPFTPADADGYAAHFARPVGVLAGEWTPRYMYDVWTPALLARSAPAAKVLVLLRDPLERYRSGLAHDLARGRAMSPELAQDHFARGLYRGQVRRLLDHFPREALLVLQYERCVADPAGELRRTYDHIGVDRTFRPDDLDRPVHRTSSPKPDVPPAVAEALRAAYAEDADALAAEVAGLDRDLWLR